MNSSRKPSPQTPQWAIVRLPDWLWGDDPLAFARRAGWKAQMTSPDRKEWKIQLSGESFNRPARLLKVQKMAHRGNVDSPGTLALLRSLPPHDEYRTHASERVAKEIEKLSKVDDDLGVLFYKIALVTTSSTEHEVDSTVKDAVKNRLLPAFPDASTWLISVDPRLAVRFAAVRVLLQSEDDPNFLNSRPSKFTGFNSASGLFSDTTVGLAAYLAPLFTSCTPYIWGFCAPRVGGVLVYNLGTTVRGHSGYVVEPLQLFHTSGPFSPPPARPDLPSEYFGEALKWWTNALNRIFYMATNPCNYMTHDDKFRVRRQFEVLLSIEQIFRNIQSISAMQRDSHARRITLLDTLDTFAGLNISSFKDMCTLSKAKRVIDELKATLPESVSAVLLPKAERAVDALERLQDGFFLESRLESGGIRLPDKRQATRLFSLEDATAAWLRVLRNAGHAFGGREVNRERDSALLIAHDGSIPFDLSELAYLYLLRLLSNPALLKNCMNQ